LGFKPTSIAFSSTIKFFSGYAVEKIRREMRGFDIKSYGFIKDGVDKQLGGMALKYLTFCIVAVVFS
jgi:hypothetical protein